MTFRSPQRELAENPELGQALSKGLELPLSALRASIESLNERLASEEHTGVLRELLREVNQLGKNVRELIEYASHPEPLPMRCTASEIARSALRGLAPDHRERVTVASIGVCGTMHADAPLLSRSVFRLIENALESGSQEVLLIVRREDAATTFSVIDASHHAFDPHVDIRPFRSSKQNHLGLGLVLTERDIALMGGSLQVERSASGETHVRVTIPDERGEDR